MNRRKWDKVLPTTDDFIVYAVDLEGEDLTANLNAGVPPRKRELLSARRLV